MTEVEQIAEQFQKDCHATVKQVVDAFIENGNKIDKGSYQDCTNVWLFQKLAEMEARLRELEL